jgi:hypothetical protein
MEENIGAEKCRDSAEFQIFSFCKEELVQIRFLNLLKKVFKLKREISSVPSLPTTKLKFET